MNARTCDALVLFGVTGDLAGKMLLPALDTLAARGELDVPVIGVARHDAHGEPVVERVRASVERGGNLSAAASARIAGRLRYVEGDLSDPTTHAELRRALGGATCPLFYLAIPPSLFAGVARELARAGFAGCGRVAVEKPFGHDLASARELEAALEASFGPDAILRIDHYLAKWSVRAITRWRTANPWLEQALSGAFVRSVQITMAEAFGVETRGSFYDGVGALRDVVQNHLLQVVAVLAMELPDRPDGKSWQDARVAALSALRPVSPDFVVRGQYDGYRQIRGVASDSQTETFVALRLEVDTPRWRGVPFCVRAGKRLPITTTEALARYAPPAGDARASHVRLRLGPGGVEIGAGLASPELARNALARELCVDLGRCHDGDAYVTLLGEALRGDASYVERADGVFAAWSALEPALRSSAPVHRYAQGSWGPAEADRVLPPGESWREPQAND